MSSDAKAQAQWFGHPRGLSTLFFTEMWERLGYYGMRAFLVFFLGATFADGGLGYNEADRSSIVGIWAASVYLLSLPGGWIADRLIGQRRAVFVGGCWISVGYLLMGVPGLPGFDGLKTICTFAGLAIVAIGTGLLKPNVSAIVGQLYSPEDARRDAGFSIFYMGINLGALIGPIVCGYLGEEVDWHLGFAAAGFGMVFGLIQYKLGAGYLGQAGLPSAADPAQRKSDLSKLLGGCLATVGVLIGVYFLGLNASQLAEILSYVIGGIGVFYFIYILAFGGLTAEERNRVIVIFMLFLGAALFWSGFEQAATSFNAFAMQYTDRNIFGWEMPASWFQSANAAYIVALAPVFAWLWIKLGKRAPMLPGKFGIGLLFLGLGFVYLAWGSTFIENETSRVSLQWLAVTYLLHTLGELCLSPVGLSSVTKLSPTRLVGQMMGIWFLGSSLGNIIAGRVGGMLGSMPMPKLFGTVAMIAGGWGLMFLIFAPVIKKLMGSKAH